MVMLDSKGQSENRGGDSQSYNTAESNQEKPAAKEPDFEASEGEDDLPF